MERGLFCGDGDDDDDDDNDDATRRRLECWTSGGGDAKLTVVGCREAPKREQQQWQQRREAPPKESTLREGAGREQWQATPHWVEYWRPVKTGLPGGDLGTKHTSSPATANSGQAVPLNTDTTDYVGLYVQSVRLRSVRWLGRLWRRC